MGALALVGALGFPSLAGAIDPLYCRGGAAMTFEQGRRGGLHLNFAPAAHSFEDLRESLPPGECTWFSRPLKDTEPYTICASGERYARFLSALQQGSLVVFQVYDDSKGCLQATTWSVDD